MAYFLRYQQLKKIAFLAVSLLLAGCDTSSTQCIAPDDFGFNNIFVGSGGYNVVNPNIDNPICSATSMDGVTPPQFIDQYSEWQPFPYVANGERVVMEVQNNSASTPGQTSGLPIDTTTSWLPWGSDTCNQSMCTALTQSGSSGSGTITGNPTSDNSGVTTASIGANYPVCTYPNDDPSVATIINGVPSLNAQNAPCWITQGRGLYCLFTDPSNPGSVNTNQTTIYNPSLVGAVNFHMGNKPFSTDSNGNPVGGINQDLSAIGSNLGGGQLYCKILDRYYCDNMGGYTIIIKSGLSSTTPSTIAGFISTVQTMLTNASEAMFNGIVKDSGFLQYLWALLVLYIAVKGIMFMFGMLKGPHQDFYTSLFRVCVVLALTNQYAWNFFYDNLFGIYVDGLPELANIFSGAYGNNDTYNSFDTLIQTLSSFQTNSKLLSIFTVDFLGGLVLILLFYSIFAVVFYLIFKAIVLLVITMVIISLLLTIAPVFFSLILFEATRQFTQAWFKVIAAYTMQGIMIGVMMGFMCTILLSELQQILGFPVCWGQWNTTLHLAYFTPTVSDKKGIINVPGSWYLDPVNQTGFCLPYECQQERYIDLPFLRPAEGNTPYDQPKIDRILGGGYIAASDLAYMALFAVLLSIINGMIPQLARGLMDMAYSFSGNALQDAMRKFDATNLKIAKFAARQLFKYSKFVRDEIMKSAGKVMGRAYRGVTGGRIFTQDMRSLEGMMARSYVGSAYRGANKAYGGVKRVISPFTRQISRYRSGRLDRLAREQITGDKLNYIDGLGLEQTRYQKGLQGNMMDKIKVGFWDQVLGPGEIERRHAANQQQAMLRTQEQMARQERRSAMWNTGIDPANPTAGSGMPNTGTTLREGTTPPPQTSADTPPLGVQQTPDIPAANNAQSPADSGPTTSRSDAAVLFDDSPPPYAPPIDGTQGLGATAQSASPPAYTPMADNNALGSQSLPNTESSTNAQPDGRAVPEQLQNASHIPTTNTPGSSTLLNQQLPGGPPADTSSGSASTPNTTPSSTTSPGTTSSGETNSS